MIQRKLFLAVWLCVAVLLQVALLGHVGFGSAHTMHQNHAHQTQLVAFDNSHHAQTGVHLSCLVGGACCGLWVPDICIGCSASTYNRFEPIERVQSPDLQKPKIPPRVWI